MITCNGLRPAPKLLELLFSKIPAALSSRGFCKKYPFKGFWKQFRSSCFITDFLSCSPAEKNRFYGL